MLSSAAASPEAAFGPDPADQVRTLIELTESLARIFEKENLAIAEKRPDDLGPLQPEKARLAAAYAQSIRAVASDRTRIASVGADLLSHLRAATESFEARAARQKGLLERA